MPSHEKLMQRCIELARLGAGAVSPNPMVGALVWHNGEIIGEGFHRQYGQAHAEVNAVAAVRDRERLAEATLYVSLEPCNHYGKTPPCTHLILQSGIRKVVVGSQDPHSKVDGAGLRHLREHGVELFTGVLEKECMDLNKRFFTYHARKRPYVILKWAETEDGYMGKDPGQVSAGEFQASRQLSGLSAMQYLHRWRSEEDAILVGANTALYDNPQLNVRHWTGKNPLRVLLAERPLTQAQLHMLEDAAPTLLFGAGPHEPLNEGVTRITPLTDVYKQVLDELHTRACLSLLVEGGAKTLQQFIDRGYWDEARIIRTPKYYANGIKAPRIGGHLMGKEKAGADEFLLIKNENVV